MSGRRAARRAELNSNKPAGFEVESEALPTASINDVIKRFYIIISFPFRILFRLLYIITTFLDKYIPRILVLRGFMWVCFIALVFNFNLLFNNAESVNVDNPYTAANVYPARRGNIFYRDIKFDRNIPLTQTTQSAEISIVPSYLRSQIDAGKYTVNDAITSISSNLNMPWDEVKSAVYEAIMADDPKEFLFLSRGATHEQGEAVIKMREQSLANLEYDYHNWIRVDFNESRSYLEGSKVGAITGYVQRYADPRSEVWKIPECQDMILNNELRGTVNTFSGLDKDGEYVKGVYGLEQKFCSELGGLNGRESTGAELGTAEAEQNRVVNGVDLVLTLDSSLQSKADEILRQSFERNTLNDTPPKNGTLVVMALEDNEEYKLKAGQVLAMSSLPDDDPNTYDDVNRVDEGGFLNTATYRNYEVGSVMKPVTVAAAINEWIIGSYDDSGERLGLDPNWAFPGYGPDGKIFTETDAFGNPLSIINAAGLYLFGEYGSGPLPVKECLRFSINTCLSDIQLSISNSAEAIKNGEINHNKYLNYLKEKFNIGKTTLVDDSATYNAGFLSIFNINSASEFVMATSGFGQGFNMSPIELMRAYTAFARPDGTLVEPHLVQSVIMDSGEVVSAYDAGEADEKLQDKIAVNNPKPVLTKKTAELMQDWMSYTHEKYCENNETFEDWACVEGYDIGIKSGTAQVSRPDSEDAGLCLAGESRYNCNNRLGIYDQTLIGFGPLGEEYEDYPKFIVLLKLSEPRPGKIDDNYASLNLSTGFEDMFDYTLKYFGVPEELELDNKQKVEVESEVASF